LFEALTLNNSAVLRISEELLYERGFANTELARDKHHLPMSVARAMPTRVQRREFVAASDQNWCGPRPRWNWRRGPSLPPPKFDFVLEGIDGVQCAMPMAMHGHTLVQFPSARGLDVTAKVGGDFFPGIQPALHVRSVTGGGWFGHIGSDLFASGDLSRPRNVAFLIRTNVGNGSI